MEQPDEKRVEEAKRGNKKPVWNSLEITKLLISVITPLVLIIIGYKVTQITEQGKNNEQWNQRIIEKRVEVYDRVGSKLNEIYCYFNYVGNWKETKPTDIITDKRILDKEMYTYRPLFSKKLFNAYNFFMDSAFKTGTGWGNDAKLRTTITFRKQYPRGCLWNDTWNSQFTEEKKNGINVHSAYEDLMSNVANDLGLTMKLTTPPPKVPPGG